MLEINYVCSLGSGVKFDNKEDNIYFDNIIKLNYNF